MALPRLRPLVTVWLPPLALMGLIFFLSAQRDLSSGLGLIDLVGRKVVHAAEFGLLCALWWRALRTVVRPRRALAAAVAISLAYAVTDELHQSFVPTRVAAPLDVVFDGVGVLAAALILRSRPGPEPRTALRIDRSRLSPRRDPTPPHGATAPPGRDPAEDRGVGR